MKKILLILFVLCGNYYSYAQQNEFLALWGVQVVDADNYMKVKVTQFRYDYSLNKNFSLQIGIRNQALLDHRESMNSVYIQNAYNTYKCDMSFLFVPVRSSFFNLKIGAGFDIGKSNYYYSTFAIITNSFTNDDSKAYVRYRMAKGYEPGIHFIIQSNYYFKNNVFFAGQILLNEVSSKVAEKGYLNSQNVLSINAGIGYRF